MLVGSRGMAKGAQLRWLYRHAAARYLDDESSAPAPLLLRAGEILDATSVSAAIDQSLANAAPHGTKVEWKDRALILIIDGDEEIGEDQQAEVLARLRDFLRRTPQRLVLSLDERQKHVWNQDIQPTAVLVTRPMEFERVLKFLKQQDTAEARQLLDVVERRQCRDIAGTPVAAGAHDFAERTPGHVRFACDAARPDRRRVPDLDASRRHPQAKCRARTRTDRVGHAVGAHAQPERR